jgi:hypothetical protein
MPNSREVAQGVLDIILHRDGDGIAQPQCSTAK